MGVSDASSSSASKNPIQPHDGPPQYVEEYRSPDYVPSFYKDYFGQFMVVEKRDNDTGEVLFTFDIEYAKVLYAEGFKRLDPRLKLPVYDLYHGDWVRDFAEQIGDAENEAKRREEWSRGQNSERQQVMCIADRRKETPRQV